MNNDFLRGMLALCCAVLTAVAVADMLSRRGTVRALIALADTLENAPLFVKPRPWWKFWGKP